MNRIKSFFGTVEQAINTIICLVGIVTVVCGVAFSGKFGEKFEAIVISVGASLIASSIVAFLSSIYITRYRRAKEITDTWGIRSIQDKRLKMNERIDECMQDAKKHYDIMAFGLRSLREENESGVIECLKRGASFRILTVNPDISELDTRDLMEGNVPGHTSKSIKELEAWVKKIERAYPGKICIKYSKYIPSEFYCRVDGTIFVGPYPYGKESQRSLTIEFKSPGKGFTLYERYFESLWNDAEYCEESN